MTTTCQYIPVYRLAHPLPSSPWDWCGVEYKSIWFYSPAEASGSSVEWSASGLPQALEKRPLLVHETRGAMVTAKRVQKLSTSMNVELVGGQEVFGRPAQIASGHGVFCPTPLMPSMTCAHVGKNPHAAVVRTVDRGERGGWTSGRFRSFMLSALICTRAFRTVRESLTQDRYGSLLALSDSHTSLTLRQSATRRGRAPTSRTHHPPTRRLSVSEHARSRAARPQVA
jgi:hypothetical protein